MEEEGKGGMTGNLDGVHGDTGAAAGVLSGSRTVSQNVRGRLCTRVRGRDNKSSERLRAGSGGGTGELSMMMDDDRGGG